MVIFRTKVNNELNPVIYSLICKDLNSFYDDISFGSWILTRKENGRVRTCGDCKEKTHAV